MYTWVQGLQHPEPEVRSEAVARICQTRTTQATEHLIHMLGQDENALVRGAVAEALQQLGDSRIVEPFIKALQEDPHWYVRLIAVDVLAHRGGNQVLAPLVNALTDEDASVRARVADALGTIRASQIPTQPLIRALRDSDVTVIENSIKALGKLREPMAISSLKSFLQQRQQTLPRLAVEALVSIGTSRAIEAVLGALGQADESFTTTILHALRQLDPSTATLLVEFLDTSSEEIRTHLIAILKAFHWRPATDRERTLYGIAQTHGHIERIIFGEPQNPAYEREQNLINPDFSEVTLPLLALDRILVYTETYQFFRLEQFLTYAINTLGQRYLKKGVEVDIHGDAGKLHANLRNTLTNLCKNVNLYPQ